MILVDSNVLFDVLTDEPVWADWSQAELDRAAASGPIIVNDVVFADISVRYAAVNDVIDVLAAMQIELAATPPSALFLAGKAYVQYRKAGGSRTGVLPDFFIGTPPSHGCRC